MAVADRKSHVEVRVLAFADGHEFMPGRVAHRFYYPLVLHAGGTFSLNVAIKCEAAGVPVHYDIIDRNRAVYVLRGVIEFLRSLRLPQDDLVALPMLKRRVTIDRYRVVVRNNIL